MCKFLGLSKGVLKYFWKFVKPEKKNILPLMTWPGNQSSARNFIYYQNNPGEKTVTNLTPDYSESEEGFTGLLLKCFSTSPGFYNN